jgi:hypothetical protein
MSQRPDSYSASKGLAESSDEIRVTLPCTPNNFAEFIARLLGHPQTISREFEFLFEVSREDLESLHHLIVQRVLQQNEASLTQFVATITYDDRSSVRINSFVDFCHYNEVRPLRSVSVMLTWVFLIRFRDRKDAEKQEINIRFISPQYLTLQQPSYYRRRPLLVKALLTFEEPQGVVEVEINYTARTWGNDVDNRVRGQIENLKHRENPVITFLHQQAHRLGFTVGTVMFFAILLGAMNYLSDYYEWRQLSVNEFLEQTRTTEELIRDSVKLLLTRELINPGYILHRELFFLLVLAGFICLLLLESSQK